MSEQRFPDVLGMLTDQRLTVEMVVQCSLGIFPQTTTLGQPIEALLLLQNLTRPTAAAPDHDAHPHGVTVTAT